MAWCVGRFGRMLQGDMIGREKQVSTGAPGPSRGEESEQGAGVTKAIRLGDRHWARWLSTMVEMFLEAKRGKC